MKMEQVCTILKKVEGVVCSKGVTLQKKKKKLCIY